MATRRPFIGARIAPSPSSSPGAGLGERIDERDERLPAAGESVYAALGLVERHRVARIGALVPGARVDVGALDEMRPHGNAVDREVDRHPAGAGEFEGIRRPARDRRHEAAMACPRRGAEQTPGGGVNGLSVRRMRLGPEAPGIGVDETRVDRSGHEFRARQELEQEREIGLRPDDHGVVKRPRKRGQRLGAGAPMNDHLGDHRIVVGRDAVAGFEAGIDPDALPRPGSSWRG